MSQSTSQLNEITRAGAGAGKTRGLVTKVVATYQHFKKLHHRPPRIVVTTFTRKATQELKERLLREACELGDPELIEYMSDGTRLQISTIHGLLSLFLRQISHLADLDAGFQILDDGLANNLSKQVLREVLLKSPESLFWLENYGLERLLDLCRNWSGAHFSSSSLTPATEQDLLNMAQLHAQQVRDSLREISQRILEEVADSKWQEYGRALAALSESWDGHQQTIVLPKKASLTAKMAEHRSLDDEIKKAIKKIKDSCDQDAWNRDLWPLMLETWHKFQALAMEFHQQLQERKRNTGQLEMADLEFYSLAILREKHFLADRFAENWDQWLVDEFQDTSETQIEILQQLIGKTPVYYVGDPQQSIYLFRGARAEIFEQQRERLRANGGVLHEKLQNWRSDPPLLHFINDMVKDLGPAFQAMEPMNNVPAPDSIVAHIVRASSPELERQKIVEEILNLRANGARFEQICILGRKHQHLMDLAIVLKEQGLPTHVHSPSGFWQRRETKDIHALWSFLLNPHDNENLITLLRTPYFYIDDVRLAEVTLSKPQSLWLRLIVTEHDNSSIAILKKARELSEESGLVAAFEWSLLESGVFDLALKSDPAGRKESNLWKFLSRVKELEREGGSGFLSMEPGVVEDESVSGGGGSTEGDAATSQEPNCINLMTIHGSKGLEFDYVLIPHMGDPPRVTTSIPFQVSAGGFSFPVYSEDLGNFVASPLEKHAVENRALREREESQRWLYVALTRAKKALWLSASEIRTGSWAETLKIFSSPSGLRNEPHYSFHVEDIETASPRNLVRQESVVAVRASYQGEETAPVGLRQSVTHILGAGSEKKLPANVIFAIAKKKSEGVIIHRVLEGLRYGVESSDPVLQGAVDYIKALGAPPMPELLVSGHAEWGFQIQTKGGLLEGQIDLWGQVEDTLWIIDYKSGSLEYKDKAFVQLELYAWALRQFGHVAKIKLAAIFPTSAQTEVRDFSESAFAHWEVKFRLS